MREFLKGLDLDKETIDTIMAEHGKLTTGYKEKAEALQAQLSEVQTQLKAFDGIDTEQLKGEISRLSADLETERQGREADRKKAETREKITSYLGGKKFVNEPTRQFYEARLTETLESEDAKGTSIDDLFKRLVTGEDGSELEGIFVSDEKAPQFTVPFSGSSGGNKTISRAEFLQMGVTERTQLKEKNPELYNKLKGR